MEKICENYDFITFALETMGNFGTHAKKFTNELGVFLNQAAGDNRAKSYNISFKELAFVYNDRIVLAF